MEEESFTNPHYVADTDKTIKGGYKTFLPRDLNIVWGGDTRYWNVPPKDDNDSTGEKHAENPVEKPAELRQVCWLEVTQFVENINPEKIYEVGFDISFAPDAFGWGPDYPVYFMTKRGKNGKALWKKTILTVSPDRIKYTRDVEPLKEQKAEGTVIHFGLYEVWSGKWKGGLKIYNAFVKEKD